MSDIRGPIEVLPRTSGLLDWYTKVVTLKMRVVVEDLSPLPDL